MRSNNCEPRDDWISHSSQSWLWLAWNQGFPRKLPVRGMLTAPLATTQGSLGQPKLRMDLQDIHSFIYWPTADKAAYLLRILFLLPLPKRMLANGYLFVLPLKPQINELSWRSGTTFWRKGLLKRNVCGTEIQNVQAALGVDSCRCHGNGNKIIFQHTGDFPLPLDIK